jgi:hypothetical protein
LLSGKTGSGSTKAGRKEEKSTATSPLGVKVKEKAAEDGAREEKPVTQGGDNYLLQRYQHYASDDDRNESDDKLFSDDDVELTYGGRAEFVPIDHDFTPR